MKIVYHIPYPKGMGADRFIYNGYQNAWKDLGHDFFTLSAKDNLKNTLEKIKPDLFFASLDYLKLPQDVNVVKESRRQGVKVFMGVGYNFDKDPLVLSIIKDPNFADIYYGEKEIECMKDFKKIVGKDYYTIPNAADKKIHFPAEPLKKYQYDIVFLGARLPLKEWFFKNVLFHLEKKYRVGIFGPYWTLKDNILRSGQKIARQLKINPVANLINSLRMSIPEEKENVFYSSTKIALNFHERENDLSQPNYILNQRTFKIPACGGFEICDDVPILKKYFTSQEIVTARLDPRDWFEKIDYYLIHEKERKTIQEAGTKRALKDHTYHNRVEQIIKMLNSLIK